MMFLLFNEQDEWCRSYANMDQVNTEILQQIQDQEDISLFRVIDISTAKSITLDIKWTVDE